MDFFEEYFEFVGESEAPNIYHRWCCISLLSAWLGRNIYLPFGHSKIYPNMFIMLMGSPGARKGTAINIAEKIIKLGGYKRFAADRTSKERFLMDIKPRSSDDFAENDVDLEMLVFNEPSEIYAIADEFTDLVGSGGMEFLTMLAKLWDNKDKYEHPKIHGRSITIDKPTVNIIAGNTAQGFALAVPPEALGNGFLSRLIFVHSEPTGKHITFPTPVEHDAHTTILSSLHHILTTLKGEMSVHDEAKSILDRMYKEFKPIDDHRFQHYSTRRFTHLLKLCMIVAVTEGRMIITREDALKANTILYITEQKMPKALGEFGRSRFSDVSNTIMEALTRTIKPMQMNDIWKLVAKDLTKQTELGEIMKNLYQAGKVQLLNVGGRQGYMPKIEQSTSWAKDLILENYLTEEEYM